MGGKVHETLKYRWKPIAMLSKGRNAFNVKDDVGPALELHSKSNCETQIGARGCYP